MKQRLCIKRDRLERIGGNGSDFQFNGGNCIVATSIPPTYIVTVQLKLKYFLAISGKGYGLGENGSIGIALGDSCYDEFGNLITSQS